MRIMIVEPGWAGFSDFMGSVKFENGVSVDDVPEHELMRIAASVRVREYRGETASGKVKLGEQQGFSANRVRITDQGAPTDKLAYPDKPNPPPEVAVTKRAPIYSFEDLAAIADKSGIKGLREVAAPLGIQARDINGLIAAILQHQEREAAKTKPRKT
jgi:hypothetical protein